MGSRGSENWHLFCHSPIFQEPLWSFIFFSFMQLWLQSCLSFPSFLFKLWGGKGLILTVGVGGCWPEACHSSLESPDTTTLYNSSRNNIATWNSVRAPGRIFTWDNLGCLVGKPPMESLEAEMEQWRCACACACVCVSAFTCAYVCLVNVKCVLGWRRTGEKMWKRNICEDIVDKARQCALYKAPLLIIYF